MQRTIAALVLLTLLVAPAFGLRVAVELQAGSDGRNLYGSPPSNAAYEIKALCEAQGWTAKLCTWESVATTAKLANYDVVVTGGSGYGSDNDFPSWDDMLVFMADKQEVGTV